MELRWAAGSLEKYEDAMGWVIRWLGEVPPGRITKQHIIIIKAEYAKRNVGPNRIAHILAALKAFLRFDKVFDVVQKCRVVAFVDVVLVPQARGTDAVAVCPSRAINAVPTISRNIERR